MASKHNTTLRVRNEIADALDRVQYEDGVSKSAVIAEAVEAWLRKRERAIAAKKRKRWLTDTEREGERPSSALMDQIEQDVVEERIEQARVGREGGKARHGL